MTSGIPSLYAYLRHVGAFPAWSRLVVLAAFGYGLVEFFLSRQADSGLVILLMLSPVCVGTGLLFAARQGKLDLLLGCGVPRLSVWRAAMLGAISPPLVGAIILAVLNAAGRGTSVSVALGQAAGIALFTLGVCAAAGIVEPRYLAGVAWLALRFAFLVTRTGSKALLLMRRPDIEDPVPPSLRMVAALAFPEVLLSAPQPALLIAVLALLGVVALFLSARFFVSAELTGRRAE